MNAADVTLGVLGCSFRFAFGALGIALSAFGLAFCVFSVALDAFDLDFGAPRRGVDLRFDTRLGFFIHVAGDDTHFTVVAVPAEDVNVLGVAIANRHAAAIAPSSLPSSLELRSAKMRS